VKRKATSLYGYSPTLAPFEGKTHAEAVAILRQWGHTVVFGGYQDPRFVEAVHRAGLQIYAEFGCFAGRDGGIGLHPAGRLRTMECRWQRRTGTVA